MKKLCVLMILLVTFLSVISCGSQDTETSASGNGDQPADTHQSIVADEATFDPENWIADGIIQEGEYLVSLTTTTFDLSYSLDGQYVYFAMKAKTGGWLALGIEPTSGMKNADMILGMVKDGEVTISDQYSSGMYGPHTADTELGGTDDILEYGGKEENGETVIEFKRQLVTGDEWDNDIDTNTNSFIVAYGSADDFGRKHSYRGNISVATALRKD